MGTNRSLPILITRTNSAELELEPLGIVAVAIFRGFRARPVQCCGFRCHDEAGSTNCYYYLVATLFLL